VHHRGTEHKNHCNQKCRERCATFIIDVNWYDNGRIVEVDSFIIKPSMRFKKRTTVINRPAVKSIDLLQIHV